MNFITAAEGQTGHGVRALHPSAGSLQSWSHGLGDHGVPVGPSGLCHLAELPCPQMGACWCAHDSPTQRVRALWSPALPALLPPWL